MNLDDLQSQWKNVIKSKTDMQSIDLSEHEIDKHLKLIQRKTIVSNFLTTVGFAISASIIFYVRSSIPDRSWMFYTSIDLILLLMLVTIALFWNRTLFWSNPYQMETSHFIKHFEKKLRLREFILNSYMPVYMIILAAAINLYYVDILTKAENILLISVYTITNLFFIVVYWLGQKHHIAKEKKLTEPIYKNLHEIKKLLKIDT